MRKFLKVEDTIVGDYDDEKRMYIKKVKESVHKMWKYKGYGIQLSVLKELKKLGCEYVLIIEDGKVEYRTEFADWTELGVKAEFGHGVQKFLPTDMMKKSYLIPE